MRALRALRSAHRRVVADPDRGTSLVEVIVAMIIMTICGAIFTGAIVSLFRANNSAQAVSDSAQQGNQAYQSLERLARYASAISTPGISTGTGDWYVELATSNTGTQVCTQLRVDITAQTLQSRTWTATSPTSTLTSWTALASNLTNASATSTSGDRPFVLITPAGSVARQQLTVTLISQSGPAGSVESSRSSYTLSALNSSVAATTNTTTCNQVSRP